MKIVQQMTLEQMRTRQSESPGVFQNVGEYLYRYSSNGVYYARFESSGKEIRRSLRTTERASAQRALAWLKQEREEIDPAQGKLTIDELSTAMRHRLGPRKHHDISPQDQIRFCDSDLSAVRTPFPAALTCG
jgi:outer membrane protein assembly factor BamB